MKAERAERPEEEEIFYNLTSRFKSLGFKVLTIKVASISYEDCISSLEFEESACYLEFSTSASMD